MTETLTLRLSPEVFQEQILTELRAADEYPPVLPKPWPPIVTPESFDELYQHRREYQRFERRFGRYETEQRLYEAHASPHTTPDRRFLKEFIDFNGKVRDTLLETPVFIAHSAFPYELPVDTMHLILWFSPEVSDHDRADYLGRVLWEEGVSTVDFVTIRNPEDLRSVKGSPHNHVFVRHRYGYDPQFPRAASW